ncbi:MAG TPA: hypothetical protein VMY35_11260 [Phycisphaerae bacterium]|nr:hypothetical protein [Phycisphaerae bacterium]
MCERLEDVCRDILKHEQLRARTWERLRRALDGQGQAAGVGDRDEYGRTVVRT